MVREVRTKAQAAPKEPDSSPILAEATVLRDAHEAILIENRRIEKAQVGDGIGNIVPGNGEFKHFFLHLLTIATFDAPLEGWEWAWDSDEM